MAPIRRYLRITKYSVLEVRIYVENPSLAGSWLLRTRDPILPRVIDAVRPLVLPKLREENALGRNKSKKKGVKDVVVEDDFEVSIFLTEAGTRHSLLTKQKHFLDKKEGGMKSNANKLTGSGSAVASEAADTPFIPIEDDEDDNLLARIPSAPINEDDNEDSGLVNGSRRRTKRGRDGDGDDGMFVPDIDSEDERPPSKRIRDISQNYADEEDGQDDKKKLGMKTSYDGFSIYGKVLCLVVKRRGGIGTTKAANGGEAMMEGWIRSTQMPVEDLDDSQET